MIKITAWLIVLFASLSVHFLGLSYLNSSKKISDITNHSQQYVNEQRAIDAFSELDQSRESSAKIEAAAQIISSQIENIPTPKIAIEKSKQEKTHDQNQTNESTKIPNKKPINTTTVNKNVSGNAAKSSISKADQSVAYSNFGSSVRKALISKLHAPLNVENVRAIIGIRFKNGALSSVYLAQSSGNNVFDAAVMKAAKTANYPKAPKGLPANSTFEIPIKI